MNEGVTGDNTVLAMAEPATQMEKERDMYKHAVKVDTFPPSSPAALDETVPFLAQHWVAESCEALIAKAAQAGALCFLLSFATSPLLNEREAAVLDVKHPVSMAILRHAPVFIDGDLTREKLLSDVVCFWLNSEVTEARLAGLRTMDKVPGQSSELWSMAKDDPAEIIRKEAVLHFARQIEKGEPNREQFDALWGLLSQSDWKANATWVWRMRWELVKKAGDAENELLKTMTEDTMASDVDILKKRMERLGPGLTFRYAVLIGLIADEKDDQVVMREILNFVPFAIESAQQPLLHCFLQQSMSHRKLRLGSCKSDRDLLNPALTRTRDTWLALLTDRSSKVRLLAANQLPLIVKAALNAQPESTIILTLGDEIINTAHIFAELMSNVLLDPLPAVRDAAMKGILHATPNASLPDDALKLITMLLKPHARISNLGSYALQLVENMDVRSAKQFLLVYRALSIQSQHKNGSEMLSALRGMVKRNHTFLKVCIPLSELRSPALREKLRLGTGPELSTDGTHSNFPGWTSRKTMRRVLRPD